MLHYAPSFASLPPDKGIEVAFAGRSNAGKSSVINCFTNRKQLARTSSAPGKTRGISLFALDDRGSRRLADLPGYGYAKVSAKEQERWGRELTRYILERESLKGVVIVMDIRHPLSGLDKQMLSLCGSGEKAVHLLLNKVDKLKNNQRAAVINRIERDLASQAADTGFSLFSARKKSGIEELRLVLNSWFEDVSGRT